MIAEEGPGRDRADPRPAAEIGVGVDRAQNAESKTPEEVTPERRLVEIGVGSQILRDLGVTRHGAADECAAVALCGPRGVRAAHRRPAPDRLSAMAGRIKAIRRGERAPARPAGSQGAHVLIIEAPYYEAISDELAAGAIAELEAAQRHLRAHRRAGCAGDPAGARAGGEGGADRLGRRRRPLRRLRGARLRHPRRDLALRHRLQQRQPLADAGRGRATPSRSATPS